MLGEPVLTDKTLDMVLGWNLVSDPLVLDIAVDSLLFMDTSDSILYTYSEALASGWLMVFTVSMGTGMSIYLL